MNPSIIRIIGQLSPGIFLENLVLLGNWVDFGIFSKLLVMSLLINQSKSGSFATKFIRKRLGFLKFIKS